jgi:hypothetical protein
MPCQEINTSKYYCNVQGGNDYRRKIRILYFLKIYLERGAVD